MDNARRKLYRRFRRKMRILTSYKKTIHLLEKVNKVEKMDKLYGYIFHFNHHKELWAAIPRGKESEYFNDMTGRVTTGILYAEDINTLIEFLTVKK